MSRSARSLSELLQPFRRYADSGEINTEVTDPAGTVALLAAEVAKADGALGVADDLDGLTVDRGDWWYNLRPSNTEPLLRLNVEAPDDESCQRHVTEILSDIERLTAG